jgi:DNA-binding beta-propeller fold protein YncE
MVVHSTVPRLTLTRGSAGVRAIAVVLLVAVASSPVLARATGDELVAQPLLTITGSDPGVAFLTPEGIALDPRHGEVLLAHTGMNRIDVFDMQGHRRAHLPHRVTGPDGKIVDGEPMSIAVDRAGHMIVSDRLAGYVDVLDYRGRSVTHLDLPATGQRIYTDGPGIVTCAPDGTILVAARGDSGHVYVFAPSYARAGEWGEPGTGPGHLSRITGLAVSPNGDIVVVCQGTQHAVQVFNRQGSFLRGFGAHEIGPGNFSFPSCTVVTRDGRIWAGDAIRQTIQVFDPSGEFLGAVGGEGNQPGEFSYPAALASDGDSLLAIVERSGSRFQLMRIR